MEAYDVVIVGSGPAGLGAAFELSVQKPELSIVILDKEKFSTGGLRNDCKMNFSYPIGFPEEIWPEELAVRHLERCAEILKPKIMEKRNIETYSNRAAKLGVSLLSVRQSHLGTDGGLKLIKSLVGELQARGVEIALEESLVDLTTEKRAVSTSKRTIRYGNLILAPGRGGFAFLQSIMRKTGIPFADNIVDIGLRIETRVERYPIVADYYDPKFLFPKKTRTFCTNSGSAYVVQEKYLSSEGKTYYSVNGHAYSGSKPGNGLVNFAILKTVSLTEPLASGQAYAEMLGIQACLLGGGRPIMQRVGDFRLGKRSTHDAFSGDLFDFEPSLASACPGDISLSVPAKVLRSIWKAMKQLDSIVPGLLHPSTVMYYPEIKLYANKPEFVDGHFRTRAGIYLIGDGAGTSRGITGAWASGIRAADGIKKEL